jgi:hypothetical protein
MPDVLLDDLDDPVRTPGPRRPDRQRGYAVTLAAYAGSVGALVVLARARRAPVSLPGPVDVVMTGLATHKLARILTKEVVTTPVRAPFTELEGSGGPAELRERPVGEGWRRSLGELLSCPFCAGVWIGTGLTAANVFTPRLGRSLSAGFASVALADWLHLLHAVAQRRAESDRPAVVLGA